MFKALLLNSIDFTFYIVMDSFNGLFFQDNLGKPAPEKQNHSGKTNLDLLEQEIVLTKCS